MGMFSNAVKTPLLCDNVASLLPNNLSINEDNQLLAFVSDSQIQLVQLPSVPNINYGNLAQELKVPYIEAEPIAQTAWVKLSFGYVLVVITVNALIQIYDHDGQKLLHFYQFEPSSKESSYDSLRGVASNGFNRIVFGCFDGEILEFEMFLETVTKNNSFAQTQKPHCDTICDLRSDWNSYTHSLLASADASGKLAVWNFDDATILAVIDGFSFPCMSLALRGDILAAGFLSGHLEIHYWKAKKSARIAAHTRLINAVTIHPTQHYVACASDDTFVSVYHLSLENNMDLKKLYCASIAPALHTGLCFGGFDHQQLVVSSYDCSELTVILTLE